MIEIFKTFELFLREPLSLFKNGLIQIVNIQDNIFANKKSINVDFVSDRAQITVINNEKVFNLLQMVNRKVKKKLHEEEKVLVSK